MNNETISKLREPFDFKDVTWKIQVTTQDKVRGMAVAYIDSRAIQRRLDETLGPTNWKNEYIPWQENSQLCGLSVYDEDKKEWVTKYDAAENTDYEPVKGGISDAFKRAACLWGVGRYLYELGGNWVEVEQRGKSSYIKDNQYPRLEVEYNKAVSQMFAAAAKPAQAPVAPTATPSAAPVQDVVPIAQAADNTQTDGTVPMYTVQSVKPSGKESQLLQLVSPVGEVIAAYVKKGDDAIKTGSKLRDVNMVQKQSTYGQYNLINDYKVAA